MRKFLLASVAALALSGCASFAGSTGQVAADVNAAVTDTANVSKGAVSIVTDVAAALAAVARPILSIVAVGAGL